MGGQDKDGDDEDGGGWVMMGMGMLRVLMVRARPMVGMVLGMVPAIPLKSLLAKFVPWPTDEAAAMKRKW